MTYHDTRTPSETIPRTLNNISVGQRAEDGYLNATAMCKAAGKRFHDYQRLDTTDAFLLALSAETVIPVTRLINSLRGGNGPQGTWVHPKVAIHLAQWLSPEFAVAVSTWVFDWLSGKTVPVRAHTRRKPRPAPMPGVHLLPGMGVLMTEDGLVTFDATSTDVSTGDRCLVVYHYHSRPQVPFVSTVEVIECSRYGDWPAETGVAHLPRHMGHTLTDRACRVLGRVVGPPSPTPPARKTDGGWATPTRSRRCGTTARGW
jgi:hypothetical protein